MHRQVERIRELEARRDTLAKRVEVSNDVNELRNLEKDISEINTELTDLRASVYAQAERMPSGPLNVIGTYAMNTYQTSSYGSDARMNGDFYSTPEYRNAFMQYVLKGVRSDILEQRADATTQTGDIGTVIPTTILDKIYEKITAHSMIWDRVTKTNVKGGVNVPTSALKPVATWVAEGSVASKQKKTTGSVIFTYHKLQCRVAVSLEASTVSLSLFENTLSENIYEAMISAIETAVVSGTGNGQPLGITKDTSIPAGQVITINGTEVDLYTKWTSIVSNVSLAYESKVVITMTKKDWDKYIVGMVDANGQPVARVTYGLSDKPERRFLGYEVVLVEDYLPTFDVANTGDVFAFIVDYKDYLFNSNLQYLFKRYFDEDTDEWISKATLIADGKLAAPHSVLLIKKAA